jgi:hypothetical protein
LPGAPSRSQESVIKLEVTSMTVVLTVSLPKAVTQPQTCRTETKG